jgi:hypothetical protein
MDKDKLIKALKDGKIPATKMPLVGGASKYKNTMKYEGSEEDFKKDRSAKMPMFPKENSRQQYNQEKAAGGALTDLTYEEWKKL